MTIPHTAYNNDDNERVITQVATGIEWVEERPANPREGMACFNYQEERAYIYINGEWSIFASTANNRPLAKIQVEETTPFELGIVLAKKGTRGKTLKLKRKQV